MRTFVITYTWSGTLEVEARSEYAAVEKAWEKLMAHPEPMNLFDYEDDTMEVTDND
tara:strand:+ start:1887 stop:2054 length:168 start_codon:yes stop_codon:yes gene_type:complete